MLVAVIWYGDLCGRGVRLRWFKHLTASNRDEKLLQIQDEFGLSGYGLYWIILEIIGEKITGDGCASVTLSGRNWARLCGVSLKKLKTFLVFAQNIELFSVKNSESDITIICNNLLKYRDEYSRKQSRKSG